VSIAGRRVIVADGGPPAALAVARSLVRAGCVVEATRAGPGDRAPRSHGVRSFPAPSPTTDAPGFVEAILRAVREGPRPAIIPTTDAAVLALLERRAEIEAASDLLLPPPAALARALDKEETLRAAKAAGVPVPETFVATSEADAERCGLAPPLVVKPAASRWRLPGGGVGGAGPAFAGDRAGLKAALVSLFVAGCPRALVQRWVPGTGCGVGVLLRDGAAAAVFVHRRLREVHPAGGPSSAAVSEPPHAGIVEPALAVLRAMEYEGLAMVEFRREGTHAVLMEVNPRPWGTLGLAIDSGVDFPRLLLEGYRGPPPRYRSAVRRRWLAGDLRRVKAAAAGPPPGYPGEFPSALAALGAALFQPAPDLVFRWSDPGPFLAEIRGAFR